MKSIYLSAVFILSLSFSALALPTPSSSSGDNALNCSIANSRGTQSLTVAGADIFPDSVSRSGDGIINMIVENPSKTFFYPINLPAGRLIKSATAYVKFDENPDASITFSINRRELTSLYDDDSIFFSVGSNGRNALRYTKADAAAEMNCIAIDGNGGNIPIEEGNIYYLTIQVRTDSESEIFISGVRINYDE